MTFRIITAYSIWMLVYFCLCAEPCTVLAQDTLSSNYTHIIQTPVIEYSKDTQLVTLTIGKITFAIPRNYIISMPKWKDTGQLELRPLLEVTYPQLEPFNDKTTQCFLSETAKRKCNLLQFWISTRLNTSFDEYQTVIDNFRHPNKNIQPLISKGPFGFKTQTIPIGTSLIQKFYFKDYGEKAYVFSCTFYKKNPKEKKCTRNMLTPKGAEIAYHFGEDKIKDIEKTDTSLVSLVDSFIISGDKK